MTAVEKVLVVGSEGMIGRSLAARLAADGRSVIRTTRKGSVGSLPLDLAGDLTSWETPGGVSIAYLCAAITSLERCRQNPEATRAVNVAATTRLAETLMRKGSFVVFLSSNLVFDGSVAQVNPAAPTNPRTEYGRQKAETERHLLQMGQQCGVVRLTKVIGAGNGLLAGWRETLLRGQPIRPFSDMVMAPIELDFAVEAIRAVGFMRSGGITQASALEDITYERAARHLADRIGAPAALIVPARAAASEFNFEWVPKHTTLDSSRLSKEFGLCPPQVWTALEHGVRG